MKEHCDGEVRRGCHEHAGLQFGGPLFRESYQRAIGYSASAPLDLPSTWSACVDLDTVIQYKLTNVANSPTSKLDLLLLAAEKSAMGFICPADLTTFDSMQLLWRHWRDDKLNPFHEQFASESAYIFNDAYQTAMGCAVPADDISQNLRRQGRPSPGRFFKTRYMMKQINWETLLHRYNTMKPKELSI